MTLSIFLITLTLNGLKTLFNMTTLEKIHQQFALHTELHFACVEVLPHALEHACQELSQALLAGNKLLSCGNAGGALLAQYFAAEMLNRTEKERPSFPAMALTTDTAVITSITHSYNFQQIFAKQIRALGQAGDILLVVSAYPENNLLQAVEAAHDRQMRVVGLIGQNDHLFMNALQPEDVALVAPADGCASILEIHLQIMHILLAVLDYQLFGIEE